MVIKKKSHGIEEEQYSAIMCDYSLLIVQKGGVVAFLSYVFMHIESIW